MGGASPWIAGNEAFEAFERTAGWLARQLDISAAVSPERQEAARAGIVAG